MYLSRYSLGLKNETIDNRITITLTLKTIKATGYSEQRKH